MGITKITVLFLLAGVGVLTAAPEGGWESFPDKSMGRATEFRGTGSARIAAYIRKPAGEGPFPIVVNLHGGNTNPEAAYSYARSTKGLVAEFIANGWAVYSIDYRGKDEPGRSGPGLDPIVYGDTIAGIETARHFPFVDPRRVALTGGSSGAHVMNRMVSRVDAACAVLYSPTYIDYGQMQKSLAEEKSPEILERMKLIRSIVDDHLKTNPAAWESFKQASALAEAPGVRCPLLIIDGGNDISLPLWMIDEYVTRLRASGKTVETFSPANGPHGFYYGDTPEAREAQQRTMAFFKKYLAPETKTR